MGNIIKFAIILGIVTLIASGVLGFVNGKTDPVIKENERLAEEKARKFVIDAVMFDKKIYRDSNGGDATYYIAYSDNEKNAVAGYTFIAYGKGYSSTIRTMVGIDTNGVIAGTKILYQQETPGLGAKATEVKYGDESGIPGFQKQYLKQNATEIAVDKDMGQIVSITGSTITSRAITNSIRETAQTVLNAIRNEGGNN